MSQTGRYDWIVVDARGQAGGELWKSTSRVCEKDAKGWMAIEDSGKDQPCSRLEIKSELEVRRCVKRICTDDGGLEREP